MSRSAGRLGRLPGQIPVGLHDLSYYVAGPLPAAPSLIETPKITDGWGMLDNDILGCCGVAGLIHGSMADEGHHKRDGLLIPSSDQVGAYYLKYTGGEDTGVVLSQFLGYVRSRPDGVLGHTG